MPKRKQGQRKQKSQRKQKNPRLRQQRKYPPFNPGNPNEWFDAIMQDQPAFIRSLCRSLRYESLLVRLPMPTRTKLCKWGMTVTGRIGIPDDANAADVVGNMPTPEQMLRQDDEEYAVLVRQEDPEALNPGAQSFWAFAAAGFRYGGGVVPQAPPEADGWKTRHLYAGAPALAAGVAFDATRDPNHYTQSAGIVAVHPVVDHLMALHPCMVFTLRWRAFDAFRYDPANYFAPQAGHDACGFVE